MITFWSSVLKDCILRPPKRIVRAKGQTETKGSWNKMSQFLCKNSTLSCKWSRRGLMTAVRLATCSCLFTTQPHMYTYTSLNKYIRTYKHITVSHKSYEANAYRHTYYLTYHQSVECDKMMFQTDDLRRCMKGHYEINKDFLERWIMQSYCELIRSPLSSKT